MQKKPLTPHMGVEITGVDLADLTSEQAQALQQAFAEHMLLVIRGQDLTRDEHKAFGRLFGELHIHPSKRDLDVHSDPEIFAIKTTPKSRWTNGELWHSDVSCEAVPPLASILYVRELPGDSGGDTLFANMCSAFDALSEPLKQWLRTLTAYHDGVKDLANYGIKLQPGQEYPNADHPLVTRHPDSGREIMFVNRAFTERINELNRAESDALLEMLWRHGESNPRFQCRVQWAPGTVVMWDNRCTWHHAVWDYYPHTRYAERVTVAGRERPQAAGEMVSP